MTPLLSYNNMGIEFVTIVVCNFYWGRGTARRAPTIGHQSEFCDRGRGRGRDRDRDRDRDHDRGRGRGRFLRDLRTLEIICPANAGQKRAVGCVHCPYTLTLQK